MFKTDRAKAAYKHMIKCIDIEHKRLAKTLDDLIDDLDVAEVVAWTLARSNAKMTQRREALVTVHGIDMEEIKMVAACTAALNGGFK